MSARAPAGLSGGGPGSRPGVSHLTQSRSRWPPSFSKSAKKDSPQQIYGNRERDCQRWKTHTSPFPTPAGRRPEQTASRLKHPENKTRRPARHSRTFRHAAAGAVRKNPSATTLTQTRGPPQRPWGPVGGACRPDNAAALVHTTQRSHLADYRGRVCLSMAPKAKKSGSKKKKITKADRLRQIQEEEEKRQKEEEEARVKYEKEEMERLEIQRIENEKLQKLEAKDLERRNEELEELYLLEACFPEAEKLKRDDRFLSQWKHYIQCDGSPDPSVAQEMNTFITLWKEEANETLEEVIEKSKLVLNDSIDKYSQRYLPQLCPVEE
nr:MAP7 domain-containing protein 1-like [Odocoileus virginianus texanus]